MYVVANEIRARAIGTTTFSIDHLMFELSDFFTCFTFLADVVLFWGSRFQFVKLNWRSGLKLATVVN
jgi:hypothetical protein